MLVVGGQLGGVDDVVELTAERVEAMEGGVALGQQAVGRAQPGSFPTMETNETISPG